MTTTTTATPPPTPAVEGGGGGRGSGRGSGQHRRSSLTKLRESLEHGAMDTYGIHTGEVHSSIGGRLGASIRFSSGRTLEEQLLAAPGAVPPVTEETGLLEKEKAEMMIMEKPAIIVWIVPALSSAVSYAFYNIFIKKGSYTINPILGGVILQFVAAILGVVTLVTIKLTDKTCVLHYDKNGMFWSCLAGLAVGVAEMLSFTVNGMGVDATQSIPVIIGGSVLFGAVLGVIALGEKLVCFGWSGVALLVVGIGLVATDPGDKVSEGGGGEGDLVAPPIYIWGPVALVCALAYAKYNIFIKLGSSSINPILGGVVLQFVAAIFGTILLGVITIAEGGPSYLNYDMTGILWSIVAGVAVGAAEILSFVVSGLGTPSTQSIPTIIGGSVMFGAVLGVIMLGETLMFQGWSGVVLIMVAIGCVALDPGASSPH